MHERLLDGQRRPSERSILIAIGNRGSQLWKQLKQFLKTNYDFTPELDFYGKKYGWCYKYRRKGKTLCVLFPEVKAFTTLVVLGKHEIAQFEESFDYFNLDTQKVFMNAFKYHDGKWLYKRVSSKSDLMDVLALIRMKSGQKGRVSIS